MPASNTPIRTFLDGGTIRIDDDSIQASIIKVQKRIVHAEINTLGHSSPVANLRQEIIIIHAMGISDLPAIWQELAQKQIEVDRVHISADKEEHLIYEHVTLMFDASQNELILQGRRYK